jgi:nicotinate phosphoribosyltransferase
MAQLSNIYRPSLALLTDLYQLTMAHGFWKLGRSEQEAVYHLLFRKNPFRGGFTLHAGLAYVADYVRDFRFVADDLHYLACLAGNDDKPLFTPEFLDYLGDLELRCDIDAVPEGTVVFPHEPLLRVTGPILQCQLLETSLLNLVNFQTLIATKAARICQAAQGEPVLEFGLRRAQGVDGALAASRAAFVGGCAATSNLLAGRLFGIPVRGTHAHSWVMAFDSELAAFERYAEMMPNNCVFLVDTYDTIGGVRHAIRIGQQLRERGHRMVGIRLDSGDLAYLSRTARKMLDDAGLTDAVIVASNDLDERIIASLKDQGSEISVWGVGTKLVTGDGQPALGGVYKMSALRRDDGSWEPKVKVSEQTLKVSTPGILQVRRYRDAAGAVADVIYDLQRPLPDVPELVDLTDPTRRRRLAGDLQYDDLLVPVVRSGRVVYACPPLVEVQQRSQQQQALFHPGVRRQVNPHQYPVGLERGLHEMRTELILAARHAATDGPPPKA